MRHITLFDTNKIDDLRQDLKNKAPIVYQLYMSRICKIKSDIELELSNLRQRYKNTENPKEKNRIKTIGKKLNEELKKYS